MIKNLQILRGIAALLVVFQHYNFYNLGVGGFGVDIFFVISGFIISFVISKDPLHFLQKRLIRILPMYYLVTMAIIAVFFIQPSLFHNVYIDGMAIVKSFLFIPYKMGESGPILSSGWTLNCEMHFYLIVAFFLLITKQARKALVLTVCYFIISCTNKYMFYYPNVNAMEFVFGVGLFFLYDRVVQQINRRITSILAVACILAFAVMIFYKYSHFPSDGYSITSLIITAYFVLSDKFWKKDSKIYQWFFRIGNASYVMYLIHPFIIFIPARLIHPFINSGNALLLVAEMLFSFALVCITSDIIHRKIEQPLLQKIRVWAGYN